MAKTATAPKVATVAVEVIWHNHQGDIEAHKAGCADVKREMKRSREYGDGETADLYTVSSYVELVEQMAASNVGDLASAYAELGTFEGLWHPEMKPCLRKLLPQNEAVTTLADVVDALVTPAVVAAVKATVAAKGLCKGGCGRGTRAARGATVDGGTCYRCLVKAARASKPVKVA
jgi:hypothetical protein